MFADVNVKGHYHLNLRLDFLDTDSFQRPYRNEISEHIQDFLKPFEDIVPKTEVESIHDGASIDAPSVDMLVSLPDVTLEQAARIGHTLRRDLELMSMTHARWSMTVDLSMSLPHID